MSSAAEDFLAARRAQRRRKQSVLPEEGLSDLEVARRLFLTGCAGLPVLWLFSAVTYRRALLDATADAELRSWVRRSVRCHPSPPTSSQAVGAAVAASLLVAWTLVFHLKWRDWNALLMCARRPLQGGSRMKILIARQDESHGSLTTHRLYPNF